MTDMPERIYAKTHGASTDVISGQRGLIGGWNEHKRDGQTEFVRADLAAPFMQGGKVKALEWSEVSEPNDDIRYTHITANSSVGRWSIEWKSWKEYDDKTIFLNGDFIGNGGDNLEAAKAAAQADYSARILPAIEPPPSPRAQALEEAEGAIDELRLQAFRTNSDADRQAYFDAVSKWFQDRHYRRMDAERALSSQPVADHIADAGKMVAGGCKGEWREIEISQPLKGRRVSPAYFPVTGEICEVSGPNCDDGKGYKWGETTVLWQNEMFVLFGKTGYWPVLHKHEHVLFRPLPASPGASATRPTGGSNHGE